LRQEDKSWEVDGKLHRDDGPAYIAADGYQAWYQYGVLHRVGGPAAIFPNGGKVWWFNNKVHRENGPAVEMNGLHKWFLDNKEYSKEAFEQEIKNRKATGKKPSPEPSELSKPLTATPEEIRDFELNYMM